MIGSHWQGLRSKRLSVVCAGMFLKRLRLGVYSTSMFLAQPLAAAQSRLVSYSSCVC